MSRQATIYVLLSTLALSTGALSLAVAVHEPAPALAQAVNNLDTLRREIADGEKACAGLEAQLARKKQEQNDNADAQRADPNNGNLKAKGSEIARQLNDLNTQLAAKRADTDGKIEGLRPPARDALKSAVALAEGGNNAALGDAKSAAAAWRDGFAKWKDYVHREEARIPPQNAEQRAAIKSERALLEAGIARLNTEHDRLKGEIDELEKLAAKNLSQADWKALKASLTQLRDDMKKRRDDIAARLKAYEARKALLAKNA